MQTRELAGTICTCIWKRGNRVTQGSFGKVARNFTSRNILKLLDQPLMFLLSSLNNVKHLITSPLRKPGKISPAFSENFLLANMWKNQTCLQVKYLPWDWHVKLFPCLDTKKFSSCICLRTFPLRISLWRPHGIFNSACAFKFSSLEMINPCLLHLL